MNTPAQVFRDLWRERLAGADRLQYVPGNNLRIDAVASVLLPGKRFLDVGCGAGMLGSLVSHKFHEIYGVDFAEDALRIAAGNGQRVQLVDLSSEPLPFSEGFFDTVTVLALLPYVYDPCYVLKECHRVLRCGGKLLLACANMRTIGKLFSIFIRGSFPLTSKGVNIGHDGGAMHYFCSRDLVSMLRTAGFSVVRRSGLYFRPEVLGGFVSRIPLLAPVLREFFAGEILVEAERL